MTKRAICPSCHYPLRVCICEAIQQQVSPVSVIILQHPSEVKHAKNSVRLLPLCLDKVEVIIGESYQDFSHLASKVIANIKDYAVFYPHQSSVDFEANIASFRHNNFNNIILVDGSWRKAYKVWQLNPWLHEVSSWHFSTPPKSRYVIRSTSVSNSLSTLEAVAYALNQGYQWDNTPLLNAFDAMQSTQLRFMQRRYKQ